MTNVRAYIEPPAELGRYLPNSKPCPRCQAPGRVVFLLQNEEACFITSRDRKGIPLGNGISLVAKVEAHIEEPIISYTEWDKAPIKSIGGYVNPTCMNGAVLALKDHAPSYYGVAQGVHAYEVFASSRSEGA